MSTFGVWLTDFEPRNRFQARLEQLLHLWMRFSTHRVGLVGLGVIVFLMIMALVVPFLPLDSPLDQSLVERLSPPSANHWFGTDSLGRDLFSRTMWGARPTLLIVIIVLVVTAPLGALVGAAAGFFGGMADRLLMRICDVFMAFPRLVLALAVAAVIGADLGTAILAISLTAWTPYARVARAEAVSLRQSDFVLGVRMLGGSSIHILVHHILPLCLPSMVVRMALDAPGIILVVSGLGFLGLGIQPPNPEWGGIVADGRSVIFEAWWVSTLPGMLILVTGLSFNMFGDALRDALDPGDS